MIFPMTRALKQLLSAVLMVAASVAASTALAAPKGSRWGPNYFPNHTVVAHTGERFRFYEELIEDKLVVFNFIYTRCDDICPLQTARLKQVVDKLSDKVGQDIFVYSVTLEPEVDTPAVLASLADAFETPPGWLFLTGDPEELGEIRYKLGERSRSLVEHRHELLWIGNDRTGGWKRYSLNADIDRIAFEILNADPEFRKQRQDIGMDYGAARAVDITHQRGRALFAKACATCHSVGDGDRLGPDLAGVAARRDPAWLTRFIQTPDLMRREKDPVAVALDAAFPGVKMPRLGLSETDVADVLAYIAAHDPEAQAAAAPAASPTP